MFNKSTGTTDKLKCTLRGFYKLVPFKTEFYHLYYRSY